MAEKMSLTELQAVIRDSLYMAFPGSFWVTAEISELKENYAGHCYIDLIEKNNDNDNIRAKARAIIWSNRLGFIQSLFKNMTGETLKTGIKVLVRVKVEYHELYGLSLIISDIDPAYTAGEIALKKQQIISRLVSEGVFEMNRELLLAPVPLRIAIISSSTAAGFGDFLTHLEKNVYGYKFTYTLFESAMQGPDTETGIINALDRIAGLTDRFDVVVIIRGGGAQSDLGWFDNYNIAYHITQFPLAVLTGIGHEKDMSVTDLVAWQALKTPTAVAGFLIDRVAEYENMLMQTFTEIKEITLSVIDEERHHIDSLKTRTVYASRAIFASKSAELKASMQRLAAAASNSLKRSREKLGSVNSTLELLRPESVLKRGYTITLVNRKPAKSRKDISNGDSIETVFIDGTISSRVE